MDRWLGWPWWPGVPLSHSGYPGVVHACQSGALLNAPTGHLDILNLDFPIMIPGVEDRYVDPRKGWGEESVYNEQARKLAALFEQNIKKFDVSDAIVAAGPKSG